MTTKANAFPSGARVYLDGIDLAIVRQAFPEGSSSHLFPHYVVDVVDGDRNVKVGSNRVGVDRKVTPNEASELRALLARTLPMLCRLGDFIGNGEIDPARAGSLGARCDLIGDIKTALEKWERSNGPCSP